VERAGGRLLVLVVSTARVSAAVSL
jgi:hypothetical protein